MLPSERAWWVKVLRAISVWADQADWHSWVVHGVLAVPLTLVLGPLTTVAFYALREAEQAAHEVMRGVRIKWLDHALDVWVPVVVAILLG